MKHEGWTPEELSPTQRTSLVLYEELLLGHAVPHGIVAASDSGQLRTGTSWTASERCPTSQTTPNGSSTSAPGPGSLGFRSPWCDPTWRSPWPNLDRPGRRSSSWRSRASAYRTCGCSQGRRRLSPQRFDGAWRGGSGMPHAPGRSLGALLLPEGELLYWAGKDVRRSTTRPKAPPRGLLGKRLLKAAGPSLS